MIAIDLIQKTAEDLMEKAAIEIPQDYLEGLQEAAKSEDGDLSSFVLQAMLDNYEAAKQDRSAMCGDTGVPRWFVKMGNEAQLEGAWSRLKPRLEKRPQMPPIIFLCGRTESTRYGVPITITILALGLLKLNMGLNLKEIGLI